MLVITLHQRLPSSPDIAEVSMPYIVEVSRAALDIDGGGAFAVARLGSGSLTRTGLHGIHIEIVLFFHKLSGWFSELVETSVRHDVRVLLPLLEP